MNHQCRHCTKRKGTDCPYADVRDDGDCVEYAPVGCLTPQCAKPAHSRGLCATCYSRWYRSESKAATRPPCTVEGCSSPSLCRGLCTYHYNVTRATEREAAKK
jgi:hypothetical protein